MKEASSSSSVLRLLCFVGYRRQDELLIDRKEAVLRIAQVSTLSTPVRRAASGSIEAHVWLLTRELVAAGNEVTVFGPGGSDVDGTMVATLPGPHGAAGTYDEWYLSEWINLCRAIEASGNFDVIHAHAYLWGTALEPFSRCPLVHTLHILPGESEARLWRSRPNARITAISQSQWSGYPDLNPAAVIPHGINLADFSFCRAASDYVCYLGRFTRGKGALEAIAAARALGLRLLLAGPVNDYFRAEIEPHVDGRQVEYVGSLTGEARDAFLGAARALLYPIQVAEPFGLVLPEAMLCGTPVAAIAKGAVPEIVDEGVTGYAASSSEGFALAVERALHLDRRRVREHAERRFSSASMAKGYLRVYLDAVARR